MILLPSRRLRRRMAMKRFVAWLVIGGAAVVCADVAAAIVDRWAAR